MTTPDANNPTMTLTTDKASYNVGDTLTLTVTYSDSNSVAQDMTITVSGKDTDGNEVSATTKVQVITGGTPGSMEISATDSFGNEYTVNSNDGTSTAVLTTTIGSPPAVDASPPVDQGGQTPPDQGVPPDQVPPDQGASGGDDQPVVNPLLCR